MKNLFLLITGGLIICFGICILVLILIINEEAPNNPDNNGRKGWATFELRTAIPKKPERIKTNRAVNLFSSVKIRKIRYVEIGWIT